MAGDSTRSGKPRAPNRVLRVIRENERHETRAQFAEALTRVALETGEEVYPDAKYVERLERGAITWPRPPYRNILTKLCGRPMSDLGFTAPVLTVSDPVNNHPGINKPLRDAIFASDMEIAQFARKVGVDPKTVQRWITKGRIPHASHRWKACQVLGREESELWTVTADPERTPGRVPDWEIYQAYAQGREFRRDISGPQHGFGLSRSDINPLLRNMSNASAVPIIAALREVQRGYLAADQLAGALSVSGAISTQIPIVEMACEVTRGPDRSQALDFACRFMEFCGWIYQDAGDLSSAMFWTDRALDYAMELGNQRTISYTLMRKSAIATEVGNPAQGLGIANSALSNSDVLTPRLRAVALRQRAHAYAALGEITEVARDSDSAIAEAVAGISQEEDDRAPYCSPMYVAMETGQSMVVAGHPKSALEVLARSHSEWSDRTQVRDYVLCVSRLATAYAAAGEVEEACNTAEEAINLAYGIGSRRVIGQLRTLLGVLGRWRNDPVIIPAQRKLIALVGSFQPE